MMPRVNREGAEIENESDDKRATEQESVSQVNRKMRSTKKGNAEQTDSNPPNRNIATGARPSLSLRPRRRQEHRPAHPLHPLP